MKNPLKTTLATAALVILPALAIAQPPAAPDGPFSPKSGACQRGDHEGGPRHQAGGRHDQGPHWLRGLNLTEQQRDQVFELMHKEAPARYSAAKQARAQHDALQKLAAAERFNEGEAKKLADTIGKAHADMTLQRLKTERQILALLTPEQRQQAANSPQRSQPGPAAK